MIQSRQIEAFRAVMLTGSMTLAAEMMHVTQPAVSRLVRDLEAELRLELFRRSGNQVTPTSQAQCLFIEVERSFVGLQTIRDFAQDLRAGRGETLRIAAMPAMAAGFLPRFVARYQRDRPHVKILMDGLPSRVIREDVVSGRLEIGVTLAPFEPHALTLTPLEDHAVVVLPGNHRLAARRKIRAADLEDEDLVLLTKFMNGRHPVERELQSVRRGNVVATPQSTIACVLASEGAGIAIVDPFSASEFAGRGVVLRAFEPATVIGTAVVYSSERALSAGGREFLDAFLDHARQFLSQADYLR